MEHRKKELLRDRLVSAACNLAFVDLGHRNARTAHSITGRRQFPAFCLVNVIGNNNQTSLQLFDPRALCRRRTAHISRLFHMSNAHSRARKWPDRRSGLACLLSGLFGAPRDDGLQGHVILARGFA